MDIKELYSIFLKHRIICTDTRKIINDSLFFALKGECFDGNMFAREALKQGCAFAIIDDKQYQFDDRYILVDDVLATLQNLAKHHRKQLNIPFIGITGTNGKTTSKELINSVLSKKFRTHATKGNLNNHIGVPLTILEIDNNTEIAIIEMGANHPQEIEILCNIADPDYGIITNIGRAHLEGFGSFQGVINTKKELFNYIYKKSGSIFINSDDKLLMDISKGIHKFTYGSKLGADSKGKYIQASPYMVMELHSTKGILYVCSKLIGDYNYHNAMSAACIGRFFDIDDIKIKEAIESYIPSNNRSQLIKTNNNTLIVDAYNANPTSMIAAIKNFTNITNNTKSLILGDMLELGKNSKEEHEKIITLLLEKKLKNVYLVGDIFYSLSSKHDYNIFKNIFELLYFLKNNPIKEQTILLKGSRGIKLEECIKLL